MNTPTAAQVLANPRRTLSRTMFDDLAWMADCTVLSIQRDDLVYYLITFTRDLTATERADVVGRVESGDETDRLWRVNAQTLRARAAAALSANATYLARVTPTASENTAQVRLLTRENTALIRLVLNKLDATD